MHFEEEGKKVALLYPGPSGLNGLNEGSNWFSHFLNVSRLNVSFFFPSSINTEFFT